MATMMVQGVSIDYIMEGEGFPLVLMPEPQSTLALWAPFIALLGEMCRTVAYAPSASHPPVPEIQEDCPSRNLRMLDLVLTAFRLERVYLASPLHSWHTAMQCGLMAPERVEALLLVELSSAAGLPCCEPSMLPGRAQLSHMQCPTLVLTRDAPSPFAAVGDMLTQTLPHCTKTVLSPTVFPPASAASLQPGHAMMHFLMHCERQRTLVRGASFLL